MISKNRKVNIKNDKKWEFDKVANSHNSNCYFGDTTDKENPFLFSIEDKNENWINLKLVGPLSGKTSFEGSKIFWKNCYKHTDIEYDVLDGCVKESIILHNQKSPFEFSFTLKIPEYLKLNKIRNGEILISRDDKTVLRIERPVAKDAKGKLYYFNFNLRKKGKLYLLTLKPVDINSFRTAKFPVIIDPTIVVISSPDLSSTNTDRKCIYSTPKGSFVCVYKDSSANLYVAESNDTLNHWEDYSIGKVGFTTDGHFSSDVDSKGIVHIVYSDDASPPDLKHISSSDNFSTEHTIDDRINVQDPALVIDGNDKLHVAYRAHTGSQYLFYASSVDYGATWAIDTIGTPSQWGGSSNPTPIEMCIACDSTNSIGVAWTVQDGAVDSKNICYALSSASWAINTITTETLSTRLQEHPSIVFDKNDDMIIAWQGQRGKSIYDIYYVLDDGASIHTVTSNDTYNQVYPTFTLDVRSTTNINHLIWSGKSATYPTNYQLRWLYFDGQAIQLPVVNVTTDNTKAHLYPSLSKKCYNNYFGLYNHNTEEIRTIIEGSPVEIWNLSDTIVSDTATVTNFDLLAPRVATPVDDTSVLTSLDTAVTLTMVWTEAHPDTNVFGVRIDPVATWTTQAGTTNTTTSVTSVTLAETIFGNDVVDIRCVHTDDFDQVTTSEVDNIGVKPLAPDKPTLSLATATTMSVSVNDSASDSVPAAADGDSFEHAIYFSGGSTTGYVQDDGTLGVSEAWNTVTEWGTKVVTGLPKRTSFTVYSKTRNPNSTSVISANSGNSYLSTISEVPVYDTITVTTPTDGLKKYIITYKIKDVDDTNLSMTFKYLDNASTYVSMVTLEGDFGNIDVTSTFATKTVTWSAGTDANNIDKENSKIRITANDGDSTVDTYTSVFDLDTKAPYFASAITIAASSVTDSTFIVTWASTVTETNFNTYEIYLSTISLQDAKNKGGTLWNKADDATMATKATVTTTITGLTRNQKYYLAFFAKDVSGNYSINDVNATQSTVYHRQIKGTIYDDKGNKISGATVCLYNRTTGVRISSTTSNTVGYYIFNFYESNTYYVVARKTNYASGIIDNLSGTIIGDSSTEEYDIVLDGDYTKQASNDLDINLTYSTAIGYIQVTKALSDLNMVVAMNQITKTVAKDQISLSVELPEKITKTVEIE